MYVWIIPIGRSASTIRYTAVGSRPSIRGRYFASASSSVSTPLHQRRTCSRWRQACTSGTSSRRSGLKLTSGSAIGRERTPGYPAGMDLALLERTPADRGEPAFRNRQVWEWAVRGAAGYDEITTLPARLRAELAREVPFSTLAVEHESLARDGTLKVLFRTRDGHPVEAGLM